MPPRPAGCSRPTATPAGAGSRYRFESHFDAIETQIGYRFRDRGKLEHALTHKSRTAEDPSGGVADNESLEFLGDAILGFVAADVLYRDFPQYTEGPKSKAKAALVSTTALAGMSRRSASATRCCSGAARRRRAAAPSRRCSPTSSRR